MEKETPYNKTNPFLARVLCRLPLSSSVSQKNTHHLELCLQGSGIKYEVGDCLAILPSHEADLIEKTLEELRVDRLKKVSYRDNKEIPIIDLISSHIDITSPTKKLLELILQKGTSPHTSILEKLFADETALKNFIGARHVWQVLKDLQPKGLEVEEIFATLPPLLPRFYSIASSQKTVGDAVHLTVGMVTYELGGNVRQGICTHFLCQQTHVEKVPVYLHPHRGFTLPKDPATHVIMVGPGTGVAPFRAFMQERIATGATGKNWLFFGERHQATNFLYGDYWKDLENRGLLKLSTAFSRDQEHKIYVQHRMLEESRTLFSWLEEGAYFYVCGDASRMAKDVEAALLQIIEKEGCLSVAEARSYLKRLRSEKRYLRDVY